MRPKVARAGWLTASLVAVAAACSPGEPRPPASTAEGLSWKKLQPAITSRTEVTAASTGSHVFLAGGFGEDQSTVATFEIFDAGAGRFTRGPDLPIPVNHSMSAVVGERFYVMGGYRGGLSDPSDRSFAFIEGKWQELAAMPEPRAAGGAAVIQGKIYVAGGVGRGGLADSTLIYDPDVNRWSTAPGLTAKREHLGVASFRDRLYVVGGRAPSNLAAAEVFDPEAGRWSRLPDMPTARGGLAAAATSNGFIVAPGGEEASGTFEEAEAFDVREGEWLSLPPLPTARHGLGVAAIGTTVFVIAGGPEPGFAFSAANESIDLASLRRGDTP